MTEIVVVFEDEDGYHYKPMGTKTITIKVKSELKKNKDAKYSICQTAKLTPKTDDEDNVEEPDENGYYDQDQIDYEMVDVKDGGEFIKKQQVMLEKYFDHKQHKVIEV